MAIGGRSLDWSHREVIHARRAKDGLRATHRVVDELVAVAYAHGRVEFDDVIDWAREADLDDSSTLDAIAQAAALAYGDRSGLPVALRNPGQTTSPFLESPPSENPR